MRRVVDTNEFFEVVPFVSDTFSFSVFQPSIATQRREALPTHRTSTPPQSTTITRNDADGSNAKLDAAGRVRKIVIDDVEHGQPGVIRRIALSTSSPRVVTESAV